MNRGTFALLSALTFAVAPACSDSGGTAVEGPFDLTFQGDASFQGAHGGQTVRVALLRSGGPTVDVVQGTVSATADPAFAFTFPDALEAGTSYTIHYWIDSNFGDGAVARCDAPTVDHQWSVGVGTVSDDVVVTESHDPAGLTDVCDTFTADLTFAGDGSFNNAHGLQPVHFALIRDLDGRVVARDESTVSSSADPSFRFEVAGGLLNGESYQVHYWIDSNFGGGTAGVCDPPANDHQWAVAIGAVTGDVDLTEGHDPANTSDVCSTFD
jgi:hypothetical protein